MQFDDYKKILMTYNLIGGAGKSSVPHITLNKSGDIWEITYTIFSTADETARVRNGEYIDDSIANYLVYDTFLYNDDNYLENVEAAFSYIVQGGAGEYAALFGRVANITFKEWPDTQNPDAVGIIGLFQVTKNWPKLTSTGELAERVSFMQPARLCG